jgi:ABC-type nitrate/sulfonate/bicarbonate transport system ATPase subunit
MFVTVDNLNFSYVDGKPVLRDISISLEKGETLAVVGASGCGKSTLLRIISGILPNGAGQKTNGHTLVNGKTPDEYRKLGKLAFMFQEATLMPNLSVKDNVEFPLKIKGVRNDKKVNELIEAVGLSEYADYLPKELSGGMKTRVALARSFVTGPELLFLDEPFAALDIAWKSKLYVELENLVERYDTTVVFVTHDVQEALLLSDNLVVLGRFGNVIHRLENRSEGTISSRVNDISGFVRSHEFQENFVAVQGWIMNDGNRSITGRAEVDRTLDKIVSCSKNGTGPWSTFAQDTIGIRDHANNEAVHNLLLEAFRKSESIEFQRVLIWDILHFNDVSDGVRREIRNFYLENLAVCSAQSLKYYKVGPDRLFDTIVDSRINGSREEYPRQKLFVYLCDLFQSDEFENLVHYLDKVIQGNIVDLDDDLARETARLVKERVISEKMGNLHSA